MRLPCTFYCYFTLLGCSSIPSLSCLTSRPDPRVSGSSKSQAASWRRRSWGPALTNGCCPTGLSTSGWYQGPSAVPGTASEEPGSGSIQGIQTGAKMGENRDKAGEKTAAWVWGPSMMQGWRPRVLQHSSNQVWVPQAGLKWGPGSWAGWGWPQGRLGRDSQDW